MPPEHAAQFYPVRGRVVLRFVGDIALGSGLLALAPLLASLWFRDTGFALRLEDTIVPDTTIGRYLADAAEGRDDVELSVILKGAARVFSFVARAQDAGPVSELKLPEGARVVCLYREGTFALTGLDTISAPWSASARGPSGNLRS